MRSTSLRARIWLSLLALFVPTISLAVAVFLVLENAQRALDTRVSANLEVRRAVNAAWHASQLARGSVYKALVLFSSSNSQLPEDVLAEVQQSLIDFELLSTALTLGSDSPEFAAHAHGLALQQWKKRGLGEKYNVPTITGARTKLVEAATDLFGKFSTQAEHVLKQLRLAFYRQISGDPARAEVIRRRILPLMGTVDLNVQEVERLFEELMANTMEELRVEQVALTKRKGSLLIGLGALWAFILALSFWITRHLWEKRVITPLGDIKHRLLKIGDGDLSTRFQVRQSDELGELMDVLNGVIANVEQSHLRAIEASRAKSEFLANMSHEIRTPLTSIVGQAEIIADHTLSLAEAKENADRIRTSGRHLNNLVNDLLDLSKIEAGKLEVELVSVPLLEKLSEACSIFEERAKAKGLGFAVHYLPGLPEQILSDPTRLVQIIQNLLSNAVKFTEKGEVIVEAGLDDGSSQAAVPRLRFVVKDTGCGISKEQQARLFRPFSQGDASITRRFGGTGLGLALSKELANRLGGDVSLAKSNLNSGSTFLFTHPVCHPIRQTAQAESGATTPELNPDLRAKLSRLKILVVDDDPEIRSLVSSFLTILGVPGEFATSGREARAKVGAWPNGFDLIFMDLSMPEEDGYSVTRELRQKGFSGPIIAFTARGLIEDRKEAINSGCNDCLLKPFSLRELTEMLIRHTALPLAAAP